MHRSTGAAYGALAVVLVSFGFLTIFSLGAPLFLTGVAMLVAWPWRRQRAVLWPALIGVWAFVGAYVLVAPFSCSTSAGLDSVTECTYLFGTIHFFGAQPGLWPAFLAGLATGAAGAFASRRLLVHRSDRPEEGQRSSA